MEYGGDTLANSLIISSIKDKLIKEIINDEALFHAINSPDITSFEDSDELINKHIFRYNQNPITLDKAITFLTLQVHIPQIYDRSGVWVKSAVEIWIISHESCMIVNNIPRISADRNDYISQLLDEKFNGRSDLGSGTFQLTSNVEGAFIKDYLYRKMVFETKDLNDSMCGG